MSGLPVRRVRLIRRRGWPKSLPCLCCGRLRTATHPGDRLHAGCRQSDDGVLRGVVRYDGGR